MNTNYLLPLRCWRWLQRWRHRRGYGIHSPFAFKLVTEVIYDRGEYYAFAELRSRFGGACCGRSSRSVCLGHDCSALSLKDLRLLFRLANHQRATRMAQLGHPDAGVGFALQAARPSAQFEIFADGAPSEVQDWSAFELIYCQDAEALGTLLAHLPLANEPAPKAPQSLLHRDSPSSPSQQLIVCRDIHRSPACSAIWESLCASAQCTVSFDLYRFGLAYLRPALHTQHYTICYF